MNKVAVAALLIAVSLYAQTSPTPASQNAAPPRPEAASQDQPKPTPEKTVEIPLQVGEDFFKTFEETSKRLIDLEYPLFRGQINIKTFPPSRCAIALTPVPVPDKRFSMQRTPASTSIDPKIVMAPQVPACPPAVAPAPATTPSESSADRK